MGSGNFREERGAHCKVQGLYAVSCAKTAEPIEMPFRMLSRVDRKNHILNAGCRSPMGRGNFEAMSMPRHARRHSAGSCANMVEPIDSPFGLWTRVGGRKHKLNRIRHVSTKWPQGMAHWRHLANTIESSLCGGDVALCQLLWPLVLTDLHCLFRNELFFVIVFKWREN